MTAMLGGADSRPFYRILVNGKETFEIDQRYQKLKYISSGAYGAVCAAEDTQTNRKVAIKKIKGTFRDLTDAKRILRELKLLRHLGGHENCIWILDIMLAPQNTRNFTDVYIVTDLMDTDLYRIIESPQVLTESHIKYFLYQMLRGLKYFHSAGILHRDLKPQNVLCNANCELVVADFGLARFVSACAHGSGTSPDGSDDAADGAAGPDGRGRAGSDPGAGSGGGNEQLTQYVVTRWYRAPELLVGNKQYGPGVDVWSTGCILAEMLGRRPLLPGRDYLDQLKLTVRILGSPSDEDTKFITSTGALKAVQSVGRCARVDWAARFPKANPQALDLLDKMLQFNPSKRISVQEALAHPFLADYHAPDDEPTAAPIDPRDWTFDRASASLTKSEIQALMVEEMEHFRGMGRTRPQSVRMAALGRAAAAAAVPTAPATQVPMERHRIRDSSAATAAPPAAAPPKAASDVMMRHSASAAPAPARPSVPAASALPVKAAPAVPVQPAVNAAVVTATAPQVRASPPKAVPAPAAPPAANGNASVSGGGGNTDALLLALLDQMKSMRTDLLGAVDARANTLEAALTAKMESKIQPLMQRIAELEQHQNSTSQQQYQRR